MGKYITENLTAKYSHKLLDHAKQSATEALKSASRSAIQKTLLIKSLIELQKAQKIPPQNSSETAKNEPKNGGFDNKITKQKFISPEQR